MDRGKFPLHFKGYLLYTAATQNTKWYGLTLEWMLSDLQILVVKRGFLLSIDKINTKQSRKQLHMVGQVLMQKLLTIQDCNGWTNGPTNLLTYRPTQQGVVTYLRLKIYRDPNSISNSSGYNGANYLIIRGTD